jgi:hypothetical protein
VRKSDCAGRLKYGRIDVLAHLCRRCNINTAEINPKAAGSFDEAAHQQSLAMIQGIRNCAALLDLFAQNGWVPPTFEDWNHGNIWKCRPQVQQLS